MEMTLMRYGTVRYFFVGEERTMKTDVDELAT